MTANKRASRDVPPRRLSHFPRPYLAVDVALFSAGPDAEEPVLHVLLHTTADGRRALPGVFVAEDETLEQAGLRALRDKGGVAGRRPRQSMTFDAVDRDERGRVVTVAQVDVVPWDELPVLQDGVELRPVSDARGLAYDHDSIVEQAVSWLRAQYDGDVPDPCGLLREPFTLAELRGVHGAVTGRAPHLTTVLRRYGSGLRRVEEKRQSRGGRPADQYVRV